MQEAVGDAILHPSIVQDVLTDIFNTGRATRGLLKFTEDALESALERQAFAQALGRAGRELGNEATNIEVIHRAFTYMDEELGKLEANIERMADQATTSRVMTAAEQTHWFDELKTWAESSAT
jgi:hypothetical protein